MISRRGFLQFASAGAVIGLVGLSRKSARAAGPSRAKRILLVVHEGGMRTSMAYNASTQTRLNPWGQLGTFGALRLGRVLTQATSAISNAAPSWAGAPTVPDITQAATHFAVIQGVDHAPGQPRAGDHSDDGVRMGTGYFGKDGAPGLLTVLNRYLGGQAAAPVATIGNLLATSASLTAAQGEWQQFAPVQLDSQNMPTPSPGAGVNLGQSIEDVLDARLRARRRGLARGYLDHFLSTKKAMRRFAPLLTNRALNLADPDSRASGVLGGITNAQLLEAVGNLTTPIDAGARDGLSAGLAIRLLQSGSPAVLLSLGEGTFDTHSNERETVPELYTRSARILAGLHFALSRIPDGSGTLLDSTLVVTMSEFGRASGDPLGYDGRNGSDHGSDDPAWRNQAHVVFGAGVRPVALAPTSDDNLPIGKPHSTQALLATICAAVGVPQSQTDTLWPANTLLYPESGPIWDLWS